MLSKREEKILRSIKVASDNNPNKPEFPPNHPKFPSTPTYKIKVPGFSDVWLKDESFNPTGTHKDRMAWEIVIAYRHFLLAKKKGLLHGPLPQMSIISSGSAAVAIQSALREYHLPLLKVLVDIRIRPQILIALERLGCEIYKTDLSLKALNWRDILALTKNHSGFDITSSEALDPSTRYYDWMSYEILNSSPDYCFIPFGTGKLYENVLNTAKSIIHSKVNDPRYKGQESKIPTCNFMGATTNDPKSKAEKLYSPHLPFVHFDEQWIRFYRTAGFCGSESDVYTIKERFLDEAMEMAHSQNINCEPSGIAGLALFLQMRYTIPTNKKILIINTGKTKYSLVSD